MLLHLFRHGQTVWNAERRVQGQSESSLNELGVQQAQELGNRLKGMHFDHIYCSSSLRARQTADLAFAQRAQPISYLDSLREIDLAPWEGHRYAEIELEHPQSFRHFWEAPHLFEVQGAETFTDLQQRAVAAIDKIRLERMDGAIAIISHGALIKSLLCHFQMKPLSELWAPPAMHNCAHSIIRLHKNGEAHIIQYADQPLDQQQNQQLGL